MSAVALRDAGPEDVPAIAAIYAHHVRYGTGSFEVDPPDAGEMGSRLAAIQRNGFPWLVAVQEARVVAYAYASAYRPRYGYRFTVEDSVYVAEAARGRGIGAKLLARLIELCTARGDRQMIAVIGDAANAASIALHERAAFRHVGMLQQVGRKFDRWLDVVFMQRALGEGSSSAPRERS
jgi:L-amino acid N-acyltransferase YncA